MVGLPEATHAPSVSPPSWTCRPRPPTTKSDGCWPPRFPPRPRPGRPAGWPRTDGKTVPLPVEDVRPIVPPFTVFQEPAGGRRRIEMAGVLLVDRQAHVRPLMWRDRCPGARSSQVSEAGILRRQGPPPARRRRAASRAQGAGQADHRQGNCAGWSRGHGQASTGMCWVPGHRSPSGIGWGHPPETFRPRGVSPLFIRSAASPPDVGVPQPLHPGRGKRSSPRRPPPNMVGTASGGWSRSPAKGNVVPCAPEAETCHQPVRPLHEELPRRSSTEEADHGIRFHLPG